jgi:UDP-N-acetylglucosamine kinase
MPPDPTPIPPEELERIYRTLIGPFLFDSSASDSGSAPTLVLLGGQPGAGKSRAGARLTAEHGGPITPLSGDDLCVFHPDYRRLISANPEQAGPVLAEATSAWVREAIQDAFENRHSLLLEGTFGDPTTTVATAARFNQAGFQVRIVAIASPRVLSIITAASRYLRDLRAGAPARFTRLSAHDRGYEGTARLVESIDPATPADRVTILSRNGRILYDHHAQSDVSPDGASAALRDGRQPTSWGARSTMEVLGELKQITAYAIASGHLTDDVAELLVEAHSLALEDVVPRLSIDADSPQARFIRQAVTEQAITLRRALNQPVPDRPETGPIEPAPGIGVHGR